MVTWDCLRVTCRLCRSMSALSRERCTLCKTASKVSVHIM